jgi:hypothetical protein
MEKKEQLKKLEELLTNLLEAEMSIVELSNDGEKMPYDFKEVLKDMKKSNLAQKVAMHVTMSKAGVLENRILEMSKDVIINTAKKIRREKKEK